LKAGKTYVPLDPNFPPERLSWILEHAQAGALLTNDRNLIAAQRLAASGVRLINIDRLSAIDREIDLPAPGPDRLAYILYTSGSPSIIPRQLSIAISSKLSKTETRP